MSLSCSCDLDDAAWYYEFSDYQEMPELPRRKRCKSCRQLINPGDDIVKAYRHRPARDDVEISIYGEEPEAVKMAPWYYCDECGGILLTLSEPKHLGGLEYCSIDIERPARELLKLHHENMESDDVD